METIKELEEETKNLIEKLHNIEKFIKENTNRDERGIFPKDKEKLLVNELNLLIFERLSLCYQLFVFH